MIHTCHAMACTTPCAPRMLFCLPHWRMTPKAIQSAVWQCYRRGQERDKRPSGRYLVVQAAAVAAVALAEGRVDMAGARARVRDRLHCVDHRLDDEDRIYLRGILAHTRSE